MVFLPGKAASPNPLIKTICVPAGGAGKTAVLLNFNTMREAPEDAEMFGFGKKMFRNREKHTTGYAERTKVAEGGNFHNRDLFIAAGRVCR